ncbi:DUF1285 domain-containing protein [Psychrobium sp. 1_MG-2023]|uniref:DUF1285 domain-containing protein n=1 Tax=Psychrobium sp. 1_MG-2023 TaxID=3062624 RepID=UPI000C31CE33|nr:DUF1285 domain-containing protein [Psychrobium sp. 1_MG-2023]MDP2561889.1 DUF1285 domain-containing protein [Psychrobium sp. 1_MG-2023]PKF59695.1 DUF1285 domain-containing protein [Alteromonadales bacterium alter-6D02]
MIDISNLEQAVNQLSGEAYPLEQWHPEHCGEMDLVIKANGQWIHQGSAIKRDKLIKLFSKVLIKQGQDFFLVTPAEKVKIKVDDAPFLIVDFSLSVNQHKQQVITLHSNIGDDIPLARPYSLELRGGEQRPYINLWRGLDALIERNTFYQLIELALAQQGETSDDVELSTLMLHSGDEKFSLGCIE